uniref:Uncharacterized protein n=1 Tax=viral metagenome TaxID=1070528 RepID=A0A6M3XFV7_9ZZZZ
MAANVPLSALRTRVRYWADAEQQATSGRYSSDEVKYRINLACKRLFNMLVQARGHGYYSKDTAWSPLTSGQALYQLPADFFELECLTVTDGSDRIDLETWQEGERAFLHGSGQGASAISELYYRLKGGAFELVPAPASTGWSYLLRYVPTSPDMDAETDAFDGINGWEEWAVLTVAIGMKDKDEADVTVLASERDRIEAQIAAMAAERDALRPDHILDVAGDWASSSTFC